MPSAKKDEVSVVQIEIDGYNKQKVVVPICAMKGGKELQKHIDLLVPCPAKISLLQGEGPIHFIGSHCVDFDGYKDVDEDEAEDDNDEASADEDTAEDNIVDQEFFWTCTLTGSKKEYKWSPEGCEDKKDDEKEVPLKASHRLLVKSAILMPSAKKDEVSVVQIEIDGYNKQKVVVPICAMKGGKDLQKHIDLLVLCPAKISLLQGEGPIHLIGSHCVNFDGYKDVDEDEAFNEAFNDEATANEDTAEDEAVDLNLNLIRLLDSKIKINKNCPHGRIFGPVTNNSRIFSFICNNEE